MEQIYSELRSMKRKYLISLYVLLFAIIAAVVLFITLGAWGLACIPVAVVSGICTSRTYKVYTESYKKNVVSGILRGCGYISDVIYSADEGISCETVAGTGMMNMASTFDSQDLVCGTYKEIEFEQSDVDIQEAWHDSDGTTSYSSIFKGRWISLKGRDDLDGRVQICAKKFRAENKKALPKRETGSEEFDKAFKVYADSEADVQKLLDLNMQRSLMRLKEKLGAPLMLMYVGDRLHIAVNDFMDSFEVNVRGKLDYESEKKRLLNEMSVTTKVIDELAVYIDG